VLCYALDFLSTSATHRYAERDTDTGILCVLSSHAGIMLKRLNGSSRYQRESSLTPKMLAKLYEVIQNEDDKLQLGGRKYRWRFASAVHAMALCPSVTSRYCTKIAKCRITETTPHKSLGILVFCCQRPWTFISNNPSVWPVNLFGQGRGLRGSRGALSTGGRRRRAIQNCAGCDFGLSSQKSLSDVNYISLTLFVSYGASKTADCVTAVSYHGII